MKQYVLIYEGSDIEYTGYFETVKKCITYVRKRYGTNTKVVIRAVYPVVENEYYSVKTGKLVNI